MVLNARFVFLIFFATHVTVTAVANLQTIFYLTKLHKEKVGDSYWLQTGAVVCFCCNFAEKKVIIQ